VGDPGGFPQPAALGGERQGDGVGGAEGVEAGVLQVVGGIAAQPEFVAAGLGDVDLIDGQTDAVVSRQIRGVNVFIARGLGAAAADIGGPDVARFGLDPDVAVEVDIQRVGAERGLAGDDAELDLDIADRHAVGVDDADGEGFGQTLGDGAVLVLARSCVHRIGGEGRDLEAEIIDRVVQPAVEDDARIELAEIALALGGVGYSVEEEIVEIDIEGMAGGGGIVTDLEDITRLGIRRGAGKACGGEAARGDAAVDNLVEVDHAVADADQVAAGLGARAVEHHGEAAGVDAGAVRQLRPLHGGADAAHGRGIARSLEGGQVLPSRRGAAVDQFAAGDVDPVGGMQVPVGREGIVKVVAVFGAGGVGHIHRGADGDGAAVVHLVIGADAEKVADARDQTRDRSGLDVAGALGPRQGDEDALIEIGHIETEGGITHLVEVGLPVGAVVAGRLPFEAGGAAADGIGSEPGDGRRRTAVAGDDAADDAVEFGRHPVVADVGGMGAIAEIGDQHDAVHVGQSDLADDDAGGVLEEHPVDLGVEISNFGIG